MEKFETAETIRRIIDDVESELKVEELLRLVLEWTISEDNSANDKFTFGQRAADKLAKFAGSSKFVIGFSVFLLIWILINGLLILRGFDPFSFILLNLMLSCLTAIQAPLIMMSQNW